MDNHYEVGTNVRGSNLLNTVRQLTQQLANLDDQFAVMSTMKDGDGSQASHFAKITAQYGFASDAISKAAYDEMNSAQGNSAALRQFLARLG